MASCSRASQRRGFVPLFNGRNLTGWFATPRTYGTLWPDGPTVADVAPGLLADDYERQAAPHIDAHAGRRSTETAVNVLEPRTGTLDTRR